MSKRPLCVMALSTAAGIVMGTVPLAAKVLAILLLVTMLCWAVWRQLHAKRLKNRQKKQMFLLLLIVMAFAGIGICRIRQCEVRQIPFQNKETAVLCGTVYDLQQKEEQIVLYLKDVVIQNNSNHSVSSDLSQFKGTCIAYCQGAETVSIGNVLTIQGTISLFEESSNPGQFHAKSYYKGLGIDFALFRTEILECKAQKAWLRQGLHNIKQTLHYQLDALAGRRAPILQAMLLGEKSGMDSERKELYQRNGISHVLVISGLHFSLLGVCVYETVRKTGVPFAVAGGISTALLFMYGIMTGFGVSAVRAFLMFAVSMGAAALGRGYDLPSALAASVLYLLLRNPYVLFQAGFLLSVGAILGIILVLPILEQVFPGKEREKEGGGREQQWKSRVSALVQAVKKGICASVGIQVMTVPILLYSFYEFSPYSVLLNCLVIPLLSVVVLCAAAAAALSFVLPWLAQIVVFPSLCVLSFYEWLCRLTERLPGSVIVTGQPKPVSIVIYYLLLAGMLLAAVWIRKKREADAEKREEKKKKIIWLKKAALVTLGFGAVYFLFIYKNRSGMQISMLDVGQGQSIYIRDGDSHMLYDGGSSDVSQVGKYRIVPFLKAMGVDRLKLVVVSHLDADHYNGIMQMLEEELMAIDCLVLPELVETDNSYIELTKLAGERGTMVKAVRSGDCFTIEEAVFEILHPKEGYEAADKNDTSVVMHLAYGDFGMLFTGDVEAAGENCMLSEQVLEPVDVLQVAHHGSASSSTTKFLEKTAPGMALISCGRDNRYGHPSKDTLTGLERAGCPCYTTMEQGCITVSIPEKESE